MAAVMDRTHRALGGAGIKEAIVLDLWELVAAARVTSRERHYGQMDLLAGAHLAVTSQPMQHISPQRHNSVMGTL